MVHRGVWHDQISNDRTISSSFLRFITGQVQLKDKKIDDDDNDYIYILIIFRERR